MKPLPQIDTPNIDLQLIDHHHAVVMYATIHRDRKHLRQWQNWPDYMQTLDDVRDLIRFSRQKYQASNGLDLAIMVEGQFAGKIGLTFIDWHQRSSEIGYWISATHQGQGLITRATQAILRYAFEQLVLSRVNIRCAEGNLRSRAIPERLGFRFEGELAHKTWLHHKQIQEVMYCMTIHRWRKQQTS